MSTRRLPRAETHDAVLVGTGLAPLVVARLLVAEGYSPLLVNPDPDYFLENSELPLDPLLEGPWTVERFRPLFAEEVWRRIAPVFPGPVRHERVPGASLRLAETESAVVEHEWLWIGDQGGETPEADDLYLAASEAGGNPVWLEDAALHRRTPGLTPSLWDRQSVGMALPRLARVTVESYRQGVREFLAERLPPEAWRLGATIEDWKGDDLVLRKGTEITHVRGRAGAWGFLTPRTAGRRNPSSLWEDWRLVSREPLRLGSVAVVPGECAFWAESPQLLRVLRRGGPGAEPADAASLAGLARLCQQRLHWSHFTARGLETRRLVWGGVGEAALGARWRLGDGPLVGVVAAAAAVGEEILVTLAEAGEAS